MLNIRCRLHGNVVAWNVSTQSIQLSFVPILVLVSACNLHATQSVTHICTTQNTPLRIYHTRCSQATRTQQTAVAVYVS